MIQKFSEYTGARKPGVYNLVAVNKDTNMEYELEVLGMDHSGRLLPDYGWDASIYVVDDDSVEIRSTGKPDHIQAKIVDLTGDDVRKDELHRAKWFIYSK